VVMKWGWFLLVSKFDFWGLVDRLDRVWGFYKVALKEGNVEDIREHLFEIRGVCYEVCRFVNEHPIPEKGLKSKVLSKKEVFELLNEKERFERRKKKVRL